jgi:hypothetical protein
MDPFVVLEGRGLSEPFQAVVPMMRRLGVFLILAGLLALEAQGQPSPWKSQVREGAFRPTLVSNQVQVLEPAGDSLWVGPLLAVYVEEAGALRLADVEVLNEGNDVVFSIEADGAAVWGGLAFDTGGNVPGAGGFLVSSDGGRTFTERPAQLDAPGDSTVVYGGATLPAVPITQQAESAPQDLAFSPAGDTVWVAGLRSGLRWTADRGKTWNRAVLPPDTSQSIDPRTPTEFLVAPPLDSGQGFLNHLSFSVLVDETGTVWAGTAKGVNRSRSVATADGSRGWHRFAASDTANSLPGNVVVDLAEQPRSNARNPIWMAAWAGQQGGQDEALQRFGVAVTADGGDTFRQTLIGERIFDLAARRARVYAVGPTGLFVSNDRGQTWRTVDDFPLRTDERVLPPEVTPRSVAVTGAALWVGTSDGLLRLDRAEEPALLDGAPTWRLFRAETPVNPDEPSEEVPDAATYAYPNPFVPSRDQLVRIAYELEQARTVEVSIYDFGMNQVRTITKRKSAGQQETVWDGTDDRGLRVPTGTYFYRVDLGGKTVQGKILVAN